MAHSLVIKLRIGAQPTSSNSAPVSSLSPLSPFAAALTPTSASAVGSALMGRPPADFSLSAQQREEFVSQQKLPAQEQLNERDSTELKHHYSSFTINSPSIPHPAVAELPQLRAAESPNTESASRPSPSTLKLTLSNKPSKPTQAASPSRGNLDGTSWSSADITLLLSLAGAHKAEVGTLSKAAWNAITDSLSVKRSEKAVQRKWEYEMAKRRGLSGREANRGMKGVVRSEQAKPGPKKSKSRLEKPKRRVKKELADPVQRSTSARDVLDEILSGVKEESPAPNEISASPVEKEPSEEGTSIAEFPSSAPGYSTAFAEAYDSLQTAHVYSNFAFIPSTPAMGRREEEEEGCAERRPEEEADAKGEPMGKDEWLAMGRMYGWVEEGLSEDESEMEDVIADGARQVELEKIAPSELVFAEDAIPSSNVFQPPTIAPLQMAPLEPTSATFAPISSFPPSAYQQGLQHFFPAISQAVYLAGSSNSNAFIPPAAESTVLGAHQTPSIPFVQAPLRSYSARYDTPRIYDSREVHRRMTALQEIASRGEAGWWREQDWKGLQQRSAPRSEAEALLAARCSDFFRRG